MEKYLIWEETDRHYEVDEGGMLIPENEVVREIDLRGERVFLIEGVEPSKADALNAKAREMNVRIWNEYDLEEVLEAVGIDTEGVHITTADDFEDPRDLLAYSVEVSEFGNLADYETTRIYRWWDGRNHRVETEPGGVGYETEVTISSDYVNLDEWDFHCRDHVTGGMGNHARIYRVLELDGKVPDEPTFLLNFWSQWQGTHQTGKVVTLDELPKVLRSLERDPDEYLAAIRELNE